MKISLNLLPYRQARRKEIRQRFWAGFGLAAGFSLLVVAGVHVGISGYISVQEGRNAFIKSQNDILDARIKEVASLRENIELVKAQQEIIGKLQSDRASPTHLLEEMTRLVPEGMFISSLKQKNSDVVVSGMAQSSDMVSSFMVLIQDSAFLTNPELIEIKASVSKEGRRMQQFSLKFTLRAPKEEKQEVVNTKTKHAGEKPLVLQTPNAAALTALPASGSSSPGMQQARTPSQGVPAAAQ